MSSALTFDADVAPALGLTPKQVIELIASDKGQTVMRQETVLVRVSLGDAASLVFADHVSGRKSLSAENAKALADAVVEVLSPLVAEQFPEVVQ